MTNLTYLISCKTKMESLLWKHSNVEDELLKHLNNMMCSVERLEDDEISFDYVVEITKFFCYDCGLDPEELDEIFEDCELEKEFLNYWTFMSSILNGN